VAQTRKRRRRKHRGTQTGRIDQRGRAGRPRSRQEARARARKQMGQKRDRPPTWSGTAGRAWFGAAIFFILLLLLFKRPVVVAFLLSAFMFLIYIPMGHALDRFMYRRRLRSQMRQREERAERKAGE
jgi:Flp pilus assembly protein TadB